MAAMPMSALRGAMMTVEDVEGSFTLEHYQLETDFAAVANALAAHTDTGSQQISRLMRETRPDVFAGETITGPEGSVS
jgi:predicted FMN-binding regulatory protein PaiB